MSENPVPAGYRIADLELDIGRRRVCRKGAELALGRLTFDLLRTLAEAAPRVVTREELAEKVWRGRFVSPATIKQRIIMLREALGDSADEPVYLRVVRGQGVALIPEPVPLYDTPVRRAYPRRRVAALGAAAVSLVAVSLHIGYSIRSPVPPDLAATVELAEIVASVPDPEAWAARVEEAVPDDIDLAEVLFRENELMLTGEAERATQVSELMRIIDQNALGRPELEILKFEGGREAGRFIINVHRLTGNE